MSKRRKTNLKARNTGEQYTNIPYCWIRSDAWRSLSGSALKVFFELHTRYNGGNNGRLILSYEEATQSLHIGKATVKRAFEDLIEKGFIKLVEPGHWYGRKASQWAITNKPQDGRSASQDWKSWTPQKAKTKNGSKPEHDPHLYVPVQI